MFVLLHKSMLMSYSSSLYLTQNTDKDLSRYTALNYLNYEHGEAYKFITLLLAYLIVWWSKTLLAIPPLVI